MVGLEEFGGALMLNVERLFDWVGVGLFLTSVCWDLSHHHTPVVLGYSK